MLVAMVLLALLAVLGTSTLNIAGIDQRIAARNRQHVLVVHTASAGNEDGRDDIRYSLPSTEGYGINGQEDSAFFITQVSGETSFGGLNYTHNLGVYRVHANYLRCGNPPPGYSTEQGRNAFRSDYWEMRSEARMANPNTQPYENTNASTATTSTMIRMVMRGGCKVR
jgi:hypothetical protein